MKAALRIRSTWLGGSLQLLRSDAHGHGTPEDGCSSVALGGYARINSFPRVPGTEAGVVSLTSLFHPVTPHKRSFHFQATVGGRPHVSDSHLAEPVTSYYAQLEGFAQACRAGARANDDEHAGGVPRRDLVEQATLLEMVSRLANLGGVP